VFCGKKKLKGPIEQLRRAVGYNRCAEFHQWLQRLRGIQGASLAVRYRSLLSRIEHEINTIALDFRYLQDKGGPHGDPTLEARTQLERARTDTGALQGLLRLMVDLYYRLSSSRRFAAGLIPESPPITQEQIDTYHAQAAQAARAARVCLSRGYLRELATPQKQSDTDIRRASRWISLEGMLYMLGDDLTGFRNIKPLWASTPSIQQLALDYGIGKADAQRVLTAYHAQTLQERSALEANPPSEINPYVTTTPPR
jgi:hypothetical protein